MGLGVARKGSELLAPMCRKTTQRKGRGSRALVAACSHGKCAAGTGPGAENPQAGSQECKERSDRQSRRWADGLKVLRG